MGGAASTRQQQRVEELCAATIRALSGDPRVHFRSLRMYRDGAPYPVGAPHLQLPSAAGDVPGARGVADGLALRLCHSSPEVHERMAPEGAVARLVFDMLEQYRVEALAPAHLPGVRSNVRRRYDSWAHAFHASGLADTALGNLLYSVSQICRSRVTGEPVATATEGLIEATRFALAPVIGHDLGRLRRDREDQAAYAVAARSIADAVTALLDEAGGDEVRHTARGRAGFSLFAPPPPDAHEATATAAPGGPPGAGPEQGYGVFTRAYDRQVDAVGTVRAAAVQEYRRRLDDRQQAGGLDVSRLARELRARLSTPSSGSWAGGQESGLLDGRRLTQLITNGAERRLFRIEQTEPVCDVVVTFLVDCSGSMRKHSESVAVVVDVLARALDLAGITNEVLGFTTGAWNGGRTLRDWRRAGRPPRPGRLNEVLHLVFKSADASRRAARLGIAGLLHEDLYREGVDGEAVQWACRRLRAREERRRLLVVVSDGGPMDGATRLVNGDGYLDDHLRNVVAREEQDETVRICGLAVGHDLGSYYRNSIALDLDAGVDMRAMREVVGLVARRAPRATTP